MVDRRPLIDGIEFLLRENLDYAINLLQIQKLKENDARVTLFKHINVVLDSAATSLILAHEYLGNMSWWEKIHDDYSRSSRPYDYKRQFDYLDQTVMNGFFLFIFNSFEHSVRLLCKQYNSQLYEKQKRSINSICIGIIKDLGLTKRNNFIDLITWLRNSYHNNGIFVPAGGLRSKSIVWNNTTYSFKENQPIKESKGDMWLSFVPISREIINFFKEIIDHNSIKNFGYYVDPAEPIR
ncbi:MAG: hypothetical protein WBX01_13925 [Nitrososphaeraceae archaeon]